MKSHDKRTSNDAACSACKMFGSLVAACSLLVLSQVTAEAVTISGGSNTILRLRDSGGRDLYPLYEYLNLSVAQPGYGGTLSFEMGGWGRLDLADKTTSDRVDGDLQYGYLRYRGDRNNLRVKLGRVWVTEGVAQERVDGAYWKSDLVAGFGASAFAGRPVVTESAFLPGGDIVYGGRISHSVPNLYTVGVSAVKTSQTDNTTDLREEEAVDLWLHPLPPLDITGTSSYDSRTGDWMEHTYRVSFTPTQALRLNGEVSKIDYRAYFRHVTTRAFSLTSGFLDPNEELLMAGGSAGVSLGKNVDLQADYRHYGYEIAGDAHFFGGRLNYVRPDSYAAGIAIHRMDGSTDRLRYNEFRVYASKRYANMDFTVDFFDIFYDQALNDVHNSYSVSGVAGYQFSSRLRGTADIEFQRSPDYDKLFQGLVKLVYAFDMNLGGQGRAK